MLHTDGILHHQSMKKANLQSASVQSGAKGPVKTSIVKPSVEPGNKSSSLRKNPTKTVAFDNSHDDEPVRFDAVGSQAKGGKKGGSKALHSTSTSSNFIHSRISGIAAHENVDSSGYPSSKKAKNNSMMRQLGAYANGSTSSTGYIDGINQEDEFEINAFSAPLREMTQPKHHYQQQNDYYTDGKDATSEFGIDKDESSELELELEKEVEQQDGDDDEEEGSVSEEQSGGKTIPLGGRKAGAKSYSTEENTQILGRVYRRQMYSLPSSDPCWKELAAQLGNIRKPSIYQKHVAEMLTDVRSVIMKLSSEEGKEMPYSSDVDVWSEKPKDKEREENVKPHVREFADACANKLRESRPKWWNRVVVAYALFIIVAQAAEIPPVQDAQGVQAMREDRKRKFQTEQDTRASLVKEARRKEEERAVRRDEEHEVLVQSVQADAEATKTIAIAAEKNAAAMANMQKSFEVCVARLSGSAEAEEVTIRLRNLETATENMEQQMGTLLCNQQEILRVLRTLSK